MAVLWRAFWVESPSTLKDARHVFVKLDERLVLSLAHNVERDQWLTISNDPAEWNSRSPAKIDSLGLLALGPGRLTVGDR
jgi:hypothetical protein